MEQGQIDAVREWRSSVTQAAVDAALEELARRRARRVAEHHAPHAGRCRAPAPPPASGPARCGTCSASTAPPRAWPTPPRRATTRRSRELRDKVERVSETLGRRLKILVGKPGLDGHSNGAEQIAVRARDAGMDVVYEGIRLTPAASRRPRWRRACTWWGCRSCRAPTWS